jgi:hypothetical protein
MKYEFDDIITEQDYKFALNTQRQLELGYHGGVTFLAKGLFYWFRYKDMRFYFKVLKKLKKKSGSDLS